ncbi:MAG: ABC transporter permease [FCB group bacterium]|nr:ABC transporter permease [FCB group bacterium]
MRRILNLFKKDVLLGIKDVFIILEVVFSVFIVFIVLFLVPKSIEPEETIYVYDRSGVIGGFMELFGSENMDLDHELFVDSREEIIAGMEKNKTALGLIISANQDGTFRTELLTQPYTSPAMMKFIDVNLEDLFSILSGNYPPDVYAAVRVTALQEGLRDEIPFNKKMLPVIIVMMVGLVGLFAMVSLVGQERSDETIRAYRVSPASLNMFLLSKHLMLLAVSVVTFSILYIPVMGLGGYVPALLIILLTVVIGSSLGILLGAFFESPMAAIGWVILLMLVISLPAISLFAPVFSPDWLKFIPSYYTLFGMDAAMFPDNNAHIIVQGIAILSGIALVLLWFSGKVFNRRIRREM